jgi:hypothetical protein
MRSAIPIVRRTCIQPGAEVVKVTTAQTTSIASAAIMPKSIGEIVDLSCDDLYVETVSSATAVKGIFGTIVGAENSLFEPTSPSSGFNKPR